MKANYAGIAALVKRQEVKRYRWLRVDFVFDHKT
jgi:hypothetical protein